MLEEEGEEEEWDPESPTMDMELDEESEGKTVMMDQEETERWQHTRDWEVVMGEEERLAFDNWTLMLLQ